MNLYYECYERPGKLPDYFYPEILKVDIGDFKITDEFISDTAGLKDKETRMLVEMLSKFCKDGSCPENAAKFGAKLKALWSKYKLALYIDKLNKYVNTMKVSSSSLSGLRLQAFSLGADCYDLGLYYVDDDPLSGILCDIKEYFLALKHYDTLNRCYNYTDRYICSNVEEYSRNALAELLKIRNYFVEHGVDFDSDSDTDSDIYPGGLLDEVIEQLETIIEYAELIKNDGKRNTFLQNFDFGFFNTWKEKLEGIDIDASLGFLKE